MKLNCSLVFSFTSDGFAKVGKLSFEHCFDLQYLHLHGTRWNSEYFDGTGNGIVLNVFFVYPYLRFLSRKFSCYYFCIIFYKSSLKNINIFQKVRFFIAIFFTCNKISVLWQLSSKIENGVNLSNYSRRFSMICSWNITKWNQMKWKVDRWILEE